MGFKDVKAAAIERLLDGRIQHEARNDIDTKNLLAIGEVTPAEVAGLLRKCTGKQHSCAPHHDHTVNLEVHVFKVNARIRAGSLQESWYVKLYLIEPDVWFISVHH